MEEEDVSRLLPQLARLGSSGLPLLRVPAGDVAMALRHCAVHLWEVMAAGEEEAAPPHLVEEAAD